jgi:glucarate dehydratase
MRIKTVRATPVAVPATRIAAFTRHKMTHIRNTVVEVETEDGTVGLGETRGEASAALLNELFAPRVRGLAVHDRRAVRAACLPREPFDYGYPEHGVWRMAYAGLETALWDLAAKEAGVPLYTYLGGAVRERAPFVAYAYAVDPAEGHGKDEVARITAGIATERVRRSGAAMFEFKIGLHPIEWEIATVRAVREALGPTTEIAVDANAGLDDEGARRFLAGVAGARLANLEEPLPSLGLIERLRADFPVPVSTHCTDLDALAARPRIDSVVSDHFVLGGIEPLIETMIGVSALSKRFWLRARWELGIGFAVMCHLGMCRKELERPAQCLIDWVEDDLIQGAPWLPQQGGVRPPDRPGLGVELDRAALARYATG